MKGDNEIQKLTKLLDTAPDKFNAKLPTIERRILSELQLLLKDLEVDRGGNIKSNLANLKLMNGIKRRLEKLVISKNYLKDVNEYIKSYIEASNLLLAYYKNIQNQSLNNPYYTAIRNTAIENSIDSLTSIGINANVIEPIRKMLLTAVTSGQSYSSLTDALRDEIVSSKENIGSLSRYAGTYTVTALSHFTGQYMAAINEDLNFNWFRFTGSLIKTSREWCIHMAEKEWVHKSELETIVSGDIDGHQVALNPANDLPRGMFDGTDATNILANKGGWNCRHQFFGVSDFMVPEEVKDKFNREIIKKYDNGGKIEVYKSVDKNSDDFKNILKINEHFAKQGKKTVITPVLNRKDPMYDIIYKNLIGTKFEGKNPDFKVGNKFYEYEGFNINKNSNPKRTFKNMISRGAVQSNNIVIEDSGVGRVWAKANIYNRIKNGANINEVWILENNGELTRLF